MARRWSMPGSRPTSLTIDTPASTALHQINYREVIIKFSVPQRRASTGSFISNQLQNGWRGIFSWPPAAGTWRNRGESRLRQGAGSSQSTDKRRISTIQAPSVAMVGVVVTLPCMEILHGVGEIAGSHHIGFRLNTLLGNDGVEGIGQQRDDDVRFLDVLLQEIRTLGNIEQDGFRARVPPRQLIRFFAQRRR